MWLFEDVTKMQQYSCQYSLEDKLLGVPQRLIAGQLKDMPASLDDM